MFSKGSFVAVVLTAIVVAGCDQTGDDVYEGPAVSLSSVEQASKRDENKDRLSLPLFVDESEWELAPYESAATTAVNLTQPTLQNMRVWGLAVEPWAGKAVVSFLDKARDSYRTMGAYCDLHSGHVLSTFELPEFVAPYAIDPSGKFAILSRRDGRRYARETLYIARLDHQQVLLDQWRPLVDPLIENPKPYMDEAEIMWASFIGSSRIATVNNAGDLHVWSFPERRRLGVFRGVSGMPTLTPDRQHVVFVASDTLVMLEPNQPSIVGYKRIGPTPKDAVVAIHPSGDKIAIGGNGEAITIDLQRDEFYSTIAGDLSADPAMRLVSDFNWAGSFLISNNRLFDSDSPMAVWRMTGTEWAITHGNEYWAVVWQDRRGGDRSKPRDLVLRSFQIPHQDIASRIDQLYQTADVLALRAGDSVRIDVSGIPIDRRDQVAEVLQRKLAAKGYFQSQTAPVTVTASIDPPKELTARYYKMWTNPDKTGHTLSYTGHHARLRISKGDRTLWSRSGMECPPTWLNEIPTNGQLDFYGAPKYTVFTEYSFPDFVRGDVSGTLGTTSFDADGLTSRTARQMTIEISGPN